MRTITKRTSAILAFTAVAVGGGVAWAAWTASGTGTGTAQAGKSINLRTAATTTSGTALYPGAKGDLKVRVVNDNGFKIQITTVARGEGDVTASQPHHGNGCAGAATGVSIPSVTAESWIVNANTTQEFTLADSVSMSNASHTACQGATFTIPVVLIGLSSA
jgi:hypothetical protein